MAPLLSVLACNVIHVIAPEDRNLAPEQFRGMNRTFYRGSPHSYFNRRLTSLILAAADNQRVGQAFEEGVTFGNLTIQGGEDYDETERMNYSVTESVVLLHHVSEALVRLFFAHEGKPPCPWLEVARLRHFPTFKRKAAELANSIDTPATIRSLLEVFRGNADTSKLVDYGWSTEKWDEDERGLKALVGGAAHRLLDEGNMYNSAKHGLALVAEEIGVEWSSETTPPDLGLSNQGPSLKYLEVKENKERGKQWHESLTWINAASYMALTQLVTLQIGLS